MDEAPDRKRSRGYLPHIDANRTYQFVTYRLADALPDKCKKDLCQLPDSDFKRQLYRRIESFLDDGHGSQLLGNPIAAIIVQDSLVFGHLDRYRLAAWSIMPMHVHILIGPNDGWTLNGIMRDHKGFTSHEIGKKLNRSGRLWQVENFDRYIRNQDHFDAVARYIEWNPVKAKLCGDPRDWAYSSANPIAREKKDLKG